MSDLEGQIFIVVGPSGVGKSSFLERIISEDPRLVDAITNTTRAMREGEGPGNPYDFVDRDTFQRRITEGYFVEWAMVHGNYYGTPHCELQRIWGQNRAVIMDVDVQGAQAIIEKYPQSVSVFILPPSEDALRQRVRSRDGQGLDEQNLALRMENAQREMALADSFSYRVVNDDFETSYRAFKKIIDDCLKLR